MSKVVELRVNNFSGGISDDPREENATKFQVTEHFDIFSQPNRLVPYRSLEADTNDGSTATGMKQYFVQDFLYASESAKLYGLGQTGAGNTKIVYKADATTGNWTLPANSEGNGAVRNGCFVEYKDFLWGFQGDNQVFKWGLLSGTPAITNSAGTVGTIYDTVTAISVNAAGTLYGVNDILTLTGGNNDAQAIVTSVSAGGGVTGVTLLEGGESYTTGSKNTTVDRGSGTGCTITVSTVADTTTTITSVANGIVARDDRAYLPYNNTLVRIYESGVVQDQALKLPTNLKITSLTNYGNYLAIGTAPVSTFNGVSRVFLWNLTSPDVQEVIDWGEGELRILETIEGMLVGVTDRYLNNDTGAGRGSMIFQVYQGGAPQVIKEVFTEALTGKSIPLQKAVKNNRVFFAAKIMTNSAGTEYREGIWSFGRKNINYPFSLTLDVVDENVNTSGIQAIGTAANYFFITHSADGSIDKTDDTETYDFTSKYVSQIFNFDDTDSDKTLQSLKVTFEKLTAGQSLTVKYRVNGATAWTTIGTYNTVDTLSHTFLREETNNKNFASGREYEFLLESTGGLEITTMTVKAIVNDNA